MDRRRHDTISEHQKYFCRYRLNLYRVNLWQKLNISDTDPNLILMDDAISYIVKNLEQAVDIHILSKLIKCAGVNPELSILN